MFLYTTAMPPPRVERGKDLGVYPNGASSASKGSSPLFRSQVSLINIKSMSLSLINSLIDMRLRWHVGPTD